MNSRKSLLKRIEEMERELLSDSLTGAFNRNFFFTKLDLTNFQGGRLYFVDLDNFKQSNDRYGHIYGDRLLRRFAKDLQACLGVEELLIRYAGDEFVIVAQKAIQLRSKQLFSQGYATIRGTNKRRLLEQADRAMYRDKNRRNIKTV